MRVLSGIQPSGNLHIGNYFGAIQQYLALQEEHECFFFVANYHALTTVKNQDELRRLTADCVRDYLALGLDPQRATIFLQSDLPEVTELAWILSTVTPMGLLHRCHAYKEKLAEGLPAEHGLFAYPVLMAADILIFDSDLVPVGQDQKQHVEVARDIAQRFNSAYGEVLRLPDPYILSETAVVHGTDGRKMSKSYGNTIGIFDDDNAVRAEVMKIQTDSKSIDEPKDPDACNLFALFRLFAGESERKEKEERYRKGGIGYKEMKERLIELILSRFAEAKRKQQEFDTQTDYMRKVLDDGIVRARQVARKTLGRVRSAVGLP